MNLELVYLYRLFFFLQILWGGCPLEGNMSTRAGIYLNSFINIRF